MSRFIILIGSLVLLTLVLVLLLIIQQKKNNGIIFELDYEELILEAIGLNTTILNYKRFEDYIVVLCKNDNDELSQITFRVKETSIEYIAGKDLKVQSFYGTIQKYGYDNYMIITGIKGSSSHIDVYFYGSMGAVSTKYSRILDIEEEYFIIINKLDRQIHYQFLVDPSTKMLDEVYEEIQ